MILDSKDGRAFDDGALKSDDLVRFAYLDETGTGDASREPNVVMAGVILHADKQWKALEDHLRGLADYHVPANRRAGFHFHAVEIYSEGSTFRREELDREARAKILEELCLIPRRFQLPIVMGHVNRALFAERHPTRSKKEALLSMLAHASVLCTVAIESYMRNSASADEVAMLVFENNSTARHVIRETHNLLRTPESVGMSEILAPFLPLERVVDTAHFAAKTDTTLLQIADICAYAIAKKLRGDADSSRFFNPISDFLVWRPDCLREKADAGQ